MRKLLRSALDMTLFFLSQPAPGGPPRPGTVERALEELEPGDRFMFTPRSRAVGVLGMPQYASFVNYDGAAQTLHYRPIATEPHVTFRALTSTPTSEITDVKKQRSARYTGAL